LAVLISLTASATLGACKRGEQPAAEVIASAPAPATPSAPEPATQPAEPGVMTLAFQKVDYLAKDIPLGRADGSRTTLGAEAGAPVLLVITWASINSGHPLELAKELLVATADLPKVQVLVANIDRPRSDEDRQLLVQMLEEAGVSAPLIVDLELKLLALINARYGRSMAGTNVMVQPPVVLFRRDLQQLDFPELESSDTESLRRELTVLVEKALASGAAAVTP
jgi:hypothetical protein